MKISFGVMMAVGLMLSCDPAITITLEQAVNLPHRSPMSSDRDEHRHPIKTLTFFGIKPEMTVVEIWPGSKGWYTEILAPFLYKKGRLVTANFDGSTGVKYFANAAEKFTRKLTQNPEIYDRVQNVVLMPPKKVNPVPLKTVDMVLTFRNMHNWINNKIDSEMFSVIHKILKDDGILGVVAHSKLDNNNRKDAQSGYLSKNLVVETIQSYGFTLIASSEINANKSDSGNHPKGVWTLPPVLRLGEKDREKYIAIGESNRMTLKFKKNLGAPN